MKNATEFSFGFPVEVSDVFYVSKDPLNPQAPRDQPQLLTIEADGKNYAVFIWTVNPKGRAVNPELIGSELTREAADALLFKTMDEAVVAMAYAL